jgi:hypothetical protein
MKISSSISLHTKPLHCFPRSRRSRTLIGRRRGLFSFRSHKASVLPSHPKPGQWRSARTFRSGHQADATDWREFRWDPENIPMDGTRTNLPPGHFSLPPPKGTAIGLNRGGTRPASLALRRGGSFHRIQGPVSTSTARPCEANRRRWLATEQANPPQNHSVTRRTALITREDSSRRTRVAGARRHRLHKADTLKLVYFLFQVAPWIESGIVKLIPAPTDFNLPLKRETWQLAVARRGDQKLPEEDLEEAHEIGRQELARAIFALPEEDLLRQLEKAVGPLTDMTKTNYLAYARQQLRNDPIALEQPLGRNIKDGRLVATRGGVNLATALIIGSQTGAFPYTNMRVRWEEIIAARDEMSTTARVWSPLTKAFQALEFRFLNNVDAVFAQRIREDGRLNTFRDFLRKVRRGADEIKDLDALDSYVRDCNDELKGEYQRAETEWSKIDEDFCKWVGRGALTVGGLMSGHLLPDVASLSGGVLATIGQLYMDAI